MLNKNGKLTMADVQNVTLAGGVTVGAFVDIMISPAAAYALGMIGCTPSMLGYKYLTPSWPGASGSRICVEHITCMA